MISCAHAVEQLWAYLDETVDDADRVLIEEHLSLCRRCCGEMEFAHELRRFLSEAAHEPDPPVEVLRRLNQTLKELEER